MSRIDDRTMKRFLTAAAIAFALTAEASATRAAPAEKASHAENRASSASDTGKTMMAQPRPGKTE